MRFFKKYLLGGCFLSCLVMMVLWPFPSYGESLTLDLGNATGMTGRILQLLIAVTVLSLAPSIVIMVTSFTRIVIVFSFLRNAMGLQQSPPNVVLASLALFMTVFIMAPTLEKSYLEGIKPLLEEKIDEEKALDRTFAPLRSFMVKNVREKDVQLFMNLANIQHVKLEQDIPYKVIIPAFIISELRRAFEIGFLIFLPFLIIDLVIASILMAMGMMMLPPVMISLPFKVIFFVLVDGWYLLCDSLIHSFK
jgi:flagellar biosynthetic protein FliP